MGNTKFQRIIKRLKIFSKFILYCKLYDFLQKRKLLIVFSVASPGLYLRKFRGSRRAASWFNLVEIRLPESRKPECFKSMSRPLSDKKLNSSALSVKHIKFSFLSIACFTEQLFRLLFAELLEFPRWPVNLTILGVDLGVGQNWR